MNEAERSLAQGFEAPGNPPRVVGHRGEISQDALDPIHPRREIALPAAVLAQARGEGLVSDAVGLAGRTQPFERVEDVVILAPVPGVLDSPVVAE